jgi:photosynthetic reaction center M subunit
MPEYQNIFTQVQVQGAPEWAWTKTATWRERIGTPGFSKLFGWFGNAQLGPIYLGWTGMVSLACGLIWFNIVGFNMLAQVGWSSPNSSASCSGWRWNRQPGIRAVDAAAQ